MKNLLSIRKAWLTLSFALGMVLLAAAQTPTKATAAAGKSTKSTSALLGAWQGTFSGAVSGNCELRLAQDGNGKPSGQLSIHPNGGEPSPFVSFESVTLEGNRLKAAFTNEQGNKVELEGALENDQLKGNWKMADGQEGSWQTTKAGKE
jgi:hypothetical protein